jgi:hypothetical protein
MDYFAVEHLSVERLLKSWRWLCPERLSLVARNAFGDLFLQDDGGNIMWLDVAIGRVTHVANSCETFRAYIATEELRKRWFAVRDETQAASRGLAPGLEQCIGFSIPLVFAESGYTENPYVADLYDHVSFLGDLHRQVAELPEGAKVKLVIKK